MFMFIKDKKLKIPREEKRYITPEPRKKLFLHLINEYNTRYPDLKIIYANLNHNPDIPIDYVLMFMSKDESNRDVLYIEVPYLYSDRTIPGYRYCVRNKLLDDFFQESVSLMTKISYDRFVEFVNVMLELSVVENSPLYWKNENNIEKFTNGLLELSARYAKK